MEKDYFAAQAAYAKRRAAMKKRFRSVKSFAAVAREFGISRQRVQQIISNGKSA